ncbi:hypothetical protein LXJ15735_10100 [Lacrimispora xylanolytica]
MGSKMMLVKGRCTLRRSCQFTADGNADCLRILIPNYKFSKVAVN